MLAKLTSSMHKPAQQTVVPSSYVPALLASIPIKKIGQLGGKLGKSLKEDLGVTTAADLLPFPEIKLQDLYGVNTGTWLWNVARGRSGDKVQGRVLPKSHSCSKTFAGPKSLKDMASERWLKSCRSAWTWTWKITTALLAFLCSMQHVT
jgi:DNA polymerase eta